MGMTKLYTATSQRLISRHGKARSTYFAAASLASRTASRESARARTTRAISGRTSLELYGKSGQSTSSLRMLLGSLVAAAGWHSSRCALIWKLKATKSSRLIFQLRVWVPGTDANGSGLSPFWATPNTMDVLPPRTGEAMRKNFQSGSRKNRRRPGNLREQVSNPYFFPTITVADTIGGAARLTPVNGKMRRVSATTGTVYGAKLRDVVSKKNFFSTPTCNSAKCNGSPSQMRRHGSLDKEVGGFLNPDWVEWLMGYPIGYTDPRRVMELRLPSAESYFLCEPTISRTTDEKALRVPRLKALGNSIVPQVAYEILKAIQEFEGSK